MLKTTTLGEEISGGEEWGWGGEWWWERGKEAFPLLLVLQLPN